jgi:hypothetical protein
MSEWTQEELAKQLEYLINCQNSGNGNVRNLSRELSLKVIDVLQFNNRKVILPL